ncbi:hypothetical protein GOP47_0019536 [Adiantum capillus-veneris]|uniref:Uncharacterized protein n=1 Tax=Adiantum capillus-veneris TaxID=13818 RepID=A0A9D4Z9Q2_ADICA|nr:hypothetical protein GOP47_0019536 [Adiantum capillus-veneris]
MALLRRLLFQPFRRVWCISLGKRLRHQQDLDIRSSSQLYKQVESCGYQDVHVMWSLLIAQQQQQLHTQQSQERS